MSLQKSLELIKLIDKLIRKKSTGTSDELANKLHISRSATMNYLSAMRKLGFPIAYDKKRRCFYYEEEGQMTTQLFEKKLSEDELKKITGGRMLINPLEFFTIRQ